MKLNEFDYQYLKGNTEFWAVRGAAFNVVYEDNKEDGLGFFGKPTKRGREMMEVYEREQEQVSTPRRV